MPKYGDLPVGVGTTVAGPTSITIGDTLTLFNNETVTAPEASIVASRATSPSGSDQGVTFQIGFAASPTDSLQILGSVLPPAAVFNLSDWVILYTSTNKQQDTYTDTNRFEYYCAYMASQSEGGNATVIAQR